MCGPLKIRQKGSDGRVITADGEVIEAGGSGTFEISVNGSSLKLHEVLYIPSIRMNLISLKQIEGSDYSITISQYKMFIIDSERQPILIAKLSNENGLDVGPVEGELLNDDETDETPDTRQLGTEENTNNYEPQTNYTVIHLALPPHMLERDILQHLLMVILKF